MAQSAPPTNTGSQRQSAFRNNVRQASPYVPTKAGSTLGRNVETLTVEFFGTLFILCLTLFTDQKSSYGDKMLAVMKRGTLTCLAFFILAMLASAGDNAAKVAKAFGFMIFMAVLFTTQGVEIIQTMDSFFKANWESNLSGTVSSSSTAEQNQSSVSSGNSIWCDIKD